MNQRDEHGLPPGVIDNDGHYEVDRIVKGRLEYLYWVQRHFAERVLPPHAEEPDEPRRAG